MNFFLENAAAEYFTIHRGHYARVFIHIHTFVTEITV
jgi:hypothetical protein